MEELAHINVLRCVSDDSISVLRYVMDPQFPAWVAPAPLEPVGSLGDDSVSPKIIAILHEQRGKVFRQKEAHAVTDAEQARTQRLYRVVAVALTDENTITLAWMQPKAGGWIGPHPRQYVKHSLPVEMERFAADLRRLLADRK